MKFDTEKCRSPRFSALIPFFVFVVFYLGLSVWAKSFDKVPMTVAFLVASATSMLLDHKQKLQNKIEVYAKGMGEPNIMIMCLIFILAGAFAQIAGAMGAINSAVNIARNLIPGNLMMAGMFLVACVISLAIGTSCGTITVLAPIALKLASPLNMDPAMLLGAIVGGSMFGDNLSMISDTTIAATRSLNVPMRDKFLMNLKPALPAVLITLVVYLFCGNSVSELAVPQIAANDILNVIPYAAILILALAGFNVMLLLFFGIVISAAIGIWLGAFDFWQALAQIGEGSKGMSTTLIVAILAGGLLKVIRYNGGIGYLILQIEKMIHSSRGCELGIMFLVAVVNLFTANNTVAIVITGPLSKALAEKYHCVPRRIAGILDSASCVIQGMIPYGAQILLALGAAQTLQIQLSSFDLMKSLFYPAFLGISLLATILLARKSTITAEN